jgi:hypothetical protein
MQQKEEVKIFLYLGLILIPVYGRLLYGKASTTIFRGLHEDRVPGSFNITPGSSFALYLGILLISQSKYSQPCLLKDQSADAP